MHRTSRCGREVHATGRRRLTGLDPTRGIAGPRRHLMNQCHVLSPPCHGGRCRPHLMRTTPGGSFAPFSDGSPDRAQPQGDTSAHPHPGIHFRPSVQHRTTPPTVHASVQLTLWQIRLKWFSYSLRPPSRLRPTAKQIGRGHSMVIHSHPRPIYSADVFSKFQTSHGSGSMSSDPPYLPATDTLALLGQRSPPVLPRFHRPPGQPRNRSGVSINLQSTLLLARSIPLWC
jgi:hypothetical protein